jgi:hypothetical protein
VESALGSVEIWCLAVVMASSLARAS